MRKLFWLILLIAAAYGGYWFIGSHYARTGLEGALQQLKAEGRADYGEVTVQGFPSRFDLTVSDPRLQSADGSAFWSAPFVQLFALSYRPNALITVFPNEQTLGWRGQEATLATDDMRASLTLATTTDLPLDHATLDAKGVRLATGLGGTLAADRVLLAARQKGAADQQEVVAVIDALSVDPGLKARFDPGGVMPPSAETARVDATLGFDRPLDRGVVNAPARLQSVEDLKARFVWGPVDLALDGAFTVNAARDAEGAVTVSARNWRKAVELLVQAGVIPADNRQRIELLLGNLAKQSADKDTLTLPLILGDGLVRFGPLPLAALPKF